MYEKIFPTKELISEQVYINEQNLLISQLETIKEKILADTKGYLNKRVAIINEFLGKSSLGNDMRVKLEGLKSEIQTKPDEFIQKDLIQIDRKIMICRNEVEQAEKQLNKLI